MLRRISTEPHLSIDELENRYLQSKNAIARTHYQTIWLLAKGKTTEEVASVTGYGLLWTYELDGIYTTASSFREFGCSLPYRLVDVLKNM